MCFVDSTKAFDRIQLKDLMEILRKHNLCRNIIAVIKSLNTNNTACVKVDTTDGIRDGVSVSPILFNLVMDEIMSSVKSECEMKT